MATNAVARAGPFFLLPPSARRSSTQVFSHYRDNQNFVKAFLLAAGHGTRLRPLTNNIPKCLVPIGGVPMLEIWFEVCRRAGIDKILINLHAHADLVRTFIKDKKPDLDIQVSEEPTLLGSAGTLVANREWVAGESSFWILYGDVLTTADLSKMVTLHRRRQPVATIGLYRVRDPGRCGIVAFDHDFVVREFEEKPMQPKSDWAFSGLMLASSELLDSIPSRFPVDLGFDVLPRLVDRMLAYPITDYLLDIGTMENYQAAQSSWPGLSVLDRQSS
jgi:mannose-1-phosphate guanylyltransferase